MRNLLLKFLYFAVPASTLAYFTSCLKGDTGSINNLEPATDLSAKLISGKISGFVTNDQNQPVQQASVTVGNLNTTTNQKDYGNRKVKPQNPETAMLAKWHTSFFELRYPK